jgi:hypothetical protein
MKTSSFKLVTTDLHSVVNYLNHNIEFSDTNYSDEMAVLTSESHRMKQKKNMIILKKHQNYIYINIIENDAPRGMFNFSKKNFIKNVTLVFENFCEEYIVPQKSISEVAYNTVGT